MKTPEMEVLLARHFNFRQNIIVPNVSWGLFFRHELDLLIITKARYGYEVEIKVSKQDLVRDKEKLHEHESKRIKGLWFAIPESLLKYQEHIPERAGIIAVSENRSESLWLRCNRVRSPQVMNKYKFTDSEVMELTRLGTMRIWNLKETIVNYRETLIN